VAREDSGGTAASFAWRRAAVAADRSFLNHLLSSASISRKSGRFSSLYTLSLAFASSESRPSEKVTDTSSVARHSKVTKTFSLRWAQMSAGTWGMFEERWRGAALRTTDGRGAGGIECQARLSAENSEAEIPSAAGRALTCAVRLIGGSERSLLLPILLVPMLHDVT
jgi:hypothetical protein